MAAADILGIPEVYVVAHLAALWTWALDNAPDGVIEASPRVFARACQWTADPTQILDALIESGFLTDGEQPNQYVIHDWHDYAGRLVERRQANADRMRRARAEKQGTPVREPKTHVQDESQFVQDTCAERAAHVQGLPNPTVPNHTNTHPNPPAGRERQAVILTAISQAEGNDAASLQSSICTALRAIGFEVKAEYPVPDRGDGRPGRVDIYAVSGSEVYAIEADWRNTREKSAFKLRQLDAFRVIALRDAEFMDVPDGIHAVVAIGGGWEWGADEDSPSEPDFEPTGRVPRRRSAPAPEITPEQQQLFDRFFASYPNREKRETALKAWSKINPDAETLKAIAAGLKRWKVSERWTKDGGRYVMLASTWLNQSCWNDEPTPASESPPGANHAAPQFRREAQSVPASYNNQL